MTNYRPSRKSSDDQLKRILTIILGSFAVLLLSVFAFLGVQYLTAASMKTETDKQPVITAAPSESSAETVPEAEPTPTPTLAPAAVPSAAPAPAPAPASAPAPAPAPVAEPAEKTNPAKLAHVPSGTQQMVVITGAKIGSNSGTLELYNKNGDQWTREMNVKAYFGKNGLVDGNSRETGNLETPTGIWEIGSFLFGKPADPPSGTQMKYKQVTDSSYWSSERNSTHNTWVNRKVSGEHLINAMPQYYYAFNTGYNSPPNNVEFGRGTAIFIHCSEPPGNALGDYTHGCIAIPREKMAELFKKLDPEKKPTCAIGTLKEGSATSIWKVTEN